MRRVRRSSIAVLVLALLGLGLAACGSSGGGSSSDKTLTATNGKVTIKAHDIGFDANKITASPGPLEITLVNNGAGTHTFTIDQPHLDIVANGRQTKSGSVTFTAGTYTFYCKIPGHRAQGMQGQLVVQ
jgi:plastocyanin